MDTRTPKSTRQRSPQARDVDELALAALAAPFPPEPGAFLAEPVERVRELPPPRDGVEPEDADDFVAESPTTVRAPASGVVARSPALAAILSAPALLAPPPERALARVPMIIMAPGPGELLVPLPPYPHGPSMVLLIGVSRARRARTGLAARLAPVPAGGALFELAPVDSLETIVPPPVDGDAGFEGPSTAANEHVEIDLEPALASEPPEPSPPSAAPSAPRDLANTPSAGFVSAPVSPSRETLPPARSRRPLTWAAAALALVGATGVLARAGLLDGLNVGFDRASSAASALEQRAQRALSRPVAQMLPSVMPAEPSEPEPSIDEQVERAKRLVNAGGAPRLREAQLLLEQARTADTQNPHVRATLGEVLLQRGLHEAAFTEAAEAVRLRPRRARYRVLLGDVYRGLGRADEAEKAYTKAAELDPQGRSVDDVDGASVRALSEL